MQNQFITTPLIQEKPLISFIITLYNIPFDMVRECIESILALNLKEREREIIIIDDGSDSPLLDEICSITDDIIYLFQPNKGQSIARNLGLKVATGEFIQFIDGDDNLLSKAYDQCIDIMRYHGADFVLFNQTREKKEFISFRTQGPITGAEYMAENNLKVSPCSYAFRREILGNIRFPEGRIVEDEEFTPMLMLQSKHLFMTKGVAYFYRKREGSTTERTDNRWKVKRLTDLEYILYRLNDKRHLFTGTKRAAIDRRIAQLTMDYLYNIIIQTKSEAHLKRAIQRLEKRGLYPLPDNAYTWKYKMFSRMMKHTSSQKALLLTLPLLKKERKE